ncbi:TetR/AcrR family transcriptional regulator [uncultured Ferrovibrio sp.]|uniref:TetR/AcrR family transcriptional regulator n=1 Tax=uncultured Ferrovibrio sp. TaxID=1576913 RepID=UPI002606CC60|nr:TetR/AcrR family transcriptional regulator [uncultured Ferrovibrio sp.]
MTNPPPVSQSGSQPATAAHPGPVPDRLLDAALACFRRLGGKRTRIEDIAAEAGVARTAVYRYYPNKRAIVAALATRWFAEDEATLAAIARDHGRGPADRLRAFLLADAACARRYVTDPCLAEVLDEVVHNLTAVPQQHRAHVRRHLTGLLAEGQAAGGFRAEPAERLAQALDDLMGRFHDPRLTADLDEAVWRERAEIAVEIACQGMRA